MTALLITYLVNAIADSIEFGARVVRDTRRDFRDAKARVRRERSRR
jgi:hypothetical protein